MQSFDPGVLAERSEARRDELERAAEEEARQKVAAHKQLVKDVAAASLTRLPALIEEAVNSGRRRAPVFYASVTSAPVWNTTTSLEDALKVLKLGSLAQLPIALDMTSAREVTTALQRLNGARAASDRFPLAYTDRPTSDQGVQANGEEITHHGHEVRIEVAW